MSPMDLSRTLRSRIAALLGSKRAKAQRDADLDDELQSHIDLAVDENIASGMTPQQARTAALRKFGGLAQTKENYRNQRGLPFLEVLARDLTYAVRQLRKSPGFTITAVLTLGIGIGVNTAIFSMMDAIVLRPLAVPDLDRVVTVSEAHGNDQKAVALANYESWQQQNRSFESLSVRKYDSLTLSGAGEAAHLDAYYTSANFFDVMRAQPLIGRVYTDAEAQPGRNNVAVLSYGFWQRHFAADPSVLGRTVQLDDRNYTIIGVMPKTMQYPSIAELFLPLAPTPQQLEDRTAHDYLVNGRLRPGVTIAQGNAELSLITDRLGKEFPASNLGWTAKSESLLEGINGDMTPLYFRLIMIATGFVMLVVCANIANLQFVRGISRGTEVAIRTALGAGRGRLLRHLLTENVLLGILGAAAGLVIAKVFLHLCVIAMPERIARYVGGWANISLNGRALAFSLLLAISAGLACGLWPALRALRVNLVDQLKSGSRTTGSSRATHRLRDIFAIAQIALSLLLVIGAALMCKGMYSMLHMADAHQPKKVLTFNAYMPPAHFKSDQKLSAFYSASLDRLRALPGVTHAEITTMLPNGQDGWEDDFRIENRPLPPGKFLAANPVVVSAGYFDALHIPLYSGRTFAITDTIDAQPVAVVSRKFAERYFPGENPIGQRIRRGNEAGKQQPSQPSQPWVRIVGVAADVNYLWVKNEADPAVYFNVIQMPPTEVLYAITTNGDALALAPEARRAMASLDATVPVDGLKTYQQYLNEAFAGLLYVAAWLAVDAFVGLLLAAIGIFGVMSNSVAERTREIGLRMAIGASRRQVSIMILRRAAILTALGVTSGIVLAGVLARLSANLLFGVSATDPVIFISITVAVTAVGLFVSWGPARRAASIDPMQALRAE